MSVVLQQHFATHNNCHLNLMYVLARTTLGEKHARLETTNSQPAAAPAPLHCSWAQRSHSEVSGILRIRESVCFETGASVVNLDFKHLQPLCLMSRLCHPLNLHSSKACHPYGFASLHHPEMRSDFALQSQQRSVCCFRS